MSRRPGCLAAWRSGDMLIIGMVLGDWEATNCLAGQAGKGSPSSSAAAAAVAAAGASVQARLLVRLQPAGELNGVRPSVWCVLRRVAPLTGCTIPGCTTNLYQSLQACKPLTSKLSRCPGLQACFAAKPRPVIAGPAQTSPLLTPLFGHDVCCQIRQHLIRSTPVPIFSSATTPHHSTGSAVPCCTVQIIPPKS